YNPYTPPIRIGDPLANPNFDHFYGEFYYLVLYNNSLSDSDIESIANNHIIPKEPYPIIFFDPTFFDGVYYVDLFNNYLGTPSYVTRVPADQKWLWVVLGARSDGFVHLDWFPIGSIVRFYNATSGALVGVVRVWGLASGDVSAVGDYRVALPPGNYTVVAYVPSTSALSRDLVAGVPAYPVANNTAYRLSNGLYLYIEYVGNGETLAWIGGRGDRVAGYIVAPDPRGKTVLFKVLDTMKNTAKPVYPVQIHPVTWTVQVTLNGTMADLTPKPDLTGLNTDYWTYNLTSYTNNTIWIHGLPLQATAIITDTTTGTPVALLTVPPTPNGTLIQLGPGNYTVTITMPPPGYIVEAQLQNTYIAPGALLAPHLYKWYLDDDRRVWKPAYIDRETNITITNTTGTNITLDKTNYTITSSPTTWGYTLTMWNLPIYSIIDIYNGTTLVKTVIVTKQPQNTTLQPTNYTLKIHIAYGIQSGTWNNITVSSPNISLTNNVLLIKITTHLSSPIYNYSLQLNLSALGFTDWSKTAPNGSDIYFLDSAGNPLYYYIENYNATTQTGIIWVNTTLTNTTIYMYFGETTNPYASYNDPHRVFLWYDDFSTDTSSQYILGASHRYTVTPTITITNGILQATVSYTNGLVKIPIKVYTGTIIEARGKLGLTGGNYQIGLDFYGVDEDIYGRLNAYTRAYEIMVSTSAGETRLASTSTTPDTNYHDIAFIWKLNGEVELCFDNNIVATATHTPVDTSYEPALFVAYNPVTDSFDWVRVRKYVDPTDYSVALIKYINILSNITYRVTTPTYYYYHYTIVFSLNINATITFTYPSTSGAPTTVLLNGTTPTYTYAQVGTTYQVNITLTTGTYNLTIITKTWRSITGEYLKYLGPPIIYYSNMTLDTRMMLMSSSTGGRDFVYGKGMTLLYVYTDSFTFGTDVYNSTTHSWLIPPSNTLNKYEWYRLIVGHYWNATSSTWWEYAKAINSTGSLTYSGSKDTGEIGSPLFNYTSSVSIERTDSGHHLYVSYVLLYADGKPVFLGDPSFYNGTGYVDPLSGYYGVSPSDPSDPLYMPRAPDTPWLWAFNNIYSDGYVHLRFFPPGTLLVFSQNDEIVKQVWITGNATWPYTVNDTRITISAGTYNVTAYLPVYPSSPVYNVSLIPATIASPTGTGALTSISSSIAYPETYLYGWINTTPITLPPVTPLVIDMRVTGTIWGFGLAPLNNYTMPYILVYSNGTTITLTYNGTTTTAPLPPITSTYAYIAMTIYPNGTLTITMSNATYPDIYGTETVLAVNATGTQWQYTVFYPFTAIIDTTGATFDFLRAYNQTDGPPIVFTNKTLVAAKWSLINTTMPNGNWTLMIPLNTTDLELTIPGPTNITLQYNIETVDSIDGLAVSTSTNKLLVYINDTLYASPVLTGIAGDLVVSYNSTALEIGVLDTGGLYSHLITIPLTNASFWGPPQVIYTGEPLTDYPWVTGNITWRSNLYYGSTETIVPASGNQVAKYRLGYYAVVANTTYTYGVGINGTNMYLYIAVNGTITKQLPLGLAYSPMIVGIGYDYDNNTGSLTIFAMKVWETVSTLQTIYTTSYISVAAPNITAAQPFAESINGTLIIDRFGLVIGQTVEKMIMGDIRMQIAGPYPVGGMVKYVTITKPITIQLAGGQVLVYPTPSSSHTITLKGFKGWTLDLALYGTSVTDTLITSDDYGLDFPPGFSAVIVADISARKISIVSAQSPPNVGGKTGQIGEKLNLPSQPYAPPPPPVLPSTGQYVNLTVLVAGIVGASIIGSKLSGNIYDGITIAGIAAAVILVALGMYSYAGISVMISIAAQAMKKALQS
ncbi:MAG: DUF2341 domain-containing protein, partial [Crenarchaeota archaeon]|nr:DUF2341 domain-containing protein [Thermoproteota archaeon]